MTSKIDGWVVFDGERIWPNTLQPTMGAVHDIVIRTDRKLDIIPVKIIPHDTWEKLMEWCKDSADRFESSVETCHGAKAEELKQILAEVEK